MNFPRLSRFLQCDYWACGHQSVADEMIDGSVLNGLLMVLIAAMFEGYIYIKYDKSTG